MIFVVSHSRSENLASKIIHPNVFGRGTTELQLDWIHHPGLLINSLKQNTICKQAAPYRYINLQILLHCCRLMCSVPNIGIEEIAAAMKGIWQTMPFTSHVDSFSIPGCTIQASLVKLKDQQLYIFRFNTSFINF